MFCLEDASNLCLGDGEAIQHEEQVHDLLVTHTTNTNEMGYQQPDIGAKGDHGSAEVGVVTSGGLAAPEANASLTGDQVRLVAWCQLRQRDVFLVASVNYGEIWVKGTATSTNSG
jgi:hypothetical protein